MFRLEAAADLRPACSTTARRVRRSSGWSRSAASSRSGERRQPGVVGQQGEQSAQVDVVEPAHAGHRLAGRQRRQHLRGLEEGPVGRGQLADGGAGRDDRRHAGRDLLGPPVRLADGVAAGRQRDQGAYLAVEDRGQGGRARHLGRPQARRDQVVQERGAGRLQREADVRSGARQAGDRGPAMGLGVGRVREQPDQQLVVHAAQQAVAGAVVQPVHGQGGGGPLGHGGQAAARAAAAAPMTSRPQSRSGRAEPGHQPAVALVPAVRPDVRTLRERRSQSSRNVASAAWSAGPAT